MAAVYSDFDLLAADEINQQENVVIGKAGNRDLTGTLYLLPKNGEPPW